MTLLSLWSVSKTEISKQGTVRSLLCESAKLSDIFSFDGGSISWPIRCREYLHGPAFGSYPFPLHLIPRRASVLGLRNVGEGSVFNFDMFPRTRERTGKPYFSGILSNSTPRSAGGIDRFAYCRVGKTAWNPLGTEQSTGILFRVNLFQLSRVNMNLT